MDSRFYYITRNQKTGLVEAVVVDNGHEETLDPRTDLVNHSDGFEFGYNGSGPAQLALAILSHFLKDDVESAIQMYQKFKEKVISKITGRECLLSEAQIKRWIECYNQKPIGDRKNIHDPTYKNVETEII